MLRTSNLYIKFTIKFQFLFSIDIMKIVRKMEKIMQKELIVVVDFGGQFAKLIARRIRELNVFSYVVSYKNALKKIDELKPLGIIFSGGPDSVNADGSKRIEREIFDRGIPILGICYGMQLMTHLLGGKIGRSGQKEYGQMALNVSKKGDLLKDIDAGQCLMSHFDKVMEAPEGFEVLASTDNCKVAAIENVHKKLYGIQFHPEVELTTFGMKLLENFLFDVCGLSGSWQMNEFVKDSVAEIKRKVGDKKVLLALSGGVDSSVVAMLIHRAIGKQLTCIFVDHGLLRKDEGDQVESIFGEQFDLNLIRVNCEERFLNALSEVEEPETKRKIIGEEFIRVFEEEAKKIGKVSFLAQGTIYPDVIESGTDEAQTIKSHHNVGGLPDHVDFDEILEPLRDLFKDEVRQVGRVLGIPDNLVSRQPFPGPGLAIRIIGDITKDKLNILKEADFIFRDELKKAGIAKNLSQYFAVLTNVKSVGVMGDERTYDYLVALRSVDTSDFMTATWSRIPLELLDKISKRIVNEVDHVSRIVYDITSKPPATVEWE